jgi:hypothetical protein
MLSVDAASSADGYRCAQPILPPAKRLPTALDNTGFTTPYCD